MQTLDVPRWILQRLALPLLPEMEATGEVQVAELYWSLPKNLRHAAMRARFERIRRAYIGGEGAHKLLLGSDKSIERYDLVMDPDEAKGLPEAVWQGRMDAAAATWRGQRDVAVGAEVVNTQDETEALRALGYVE